MIMSLVFSDAKREQKVDLNGYWSCMASLEIPSSTLLIIPGPAVNFWWSQVLIKLVFRCHGYWGYFYILSG